MKKHRQDSKGGVEEMSDVGRKEKRGCVRGGMQRQNRWSAGMIKKMAAGICGHAEALFESRLGKAVTQRKGGSLQLTAI